MKNKLETVEAPVQEVSESIIEPATTYKWNPEDQFRFDGKEYSLVFNSLEQIVNSPSFQSKVIEANEVMTILNIHQLVKQKLEKAIKDGVAVKVVTEEVSKN